jgi:hypothetical protein
MIVLFALGGFVMGILAMVLQGHRHRCTRGGAEHEFEKAATQVESFPPGYTFSPANMVWADNVKLVTEVYHGHVCVHCGKVVNAEARPNGSWTPPPMGVAPQE